MSTDGKASGHSRKWFDKNFVPFLLNLKLGARTTRNMLHFLFYTTKIIIIISKLILKLKSLMEEYYNIKFIYFDEKNIFFKYFLLNVSYLEYSLYILEYSYLFWYTSIYIFLYTHFLQACLNKVTEKFSLMFMCILHMNIGQFQGVKEVLKMR